MHVNSYLCYKRRLNNLRQRPKAWEMILPVALWIMGLLAAVHQWPRTGILSPIKVTRGALEALAVAAGGGPVDANLLALSWWWISLWLDRMLCETPDLKMDKGIDNGTVHIHLLSALHCCGSCHQSRVCFVVSGFLIRLPKLHRYKSFPWLAWACSLYM